MPDFFEQKYRVRYSDAGASGFLRPWVLFNLFQDTASVHAWNEGVSALHMAERGLAWVVRAYSLEISSLPAWNEELRVKTWRYPHRNLYELRAYEVMGKSGQFYALAKSAWVLVRTDTGQPVRLGKNMPSGFSAGHEIIFEIPEIPEPEDNISSASFDAREWDIDYNRHVNNAVFIKMMIESLPHEFPETTVTGLDAVFMRPAYAGNRLECIAGKKITGNQSVFNCMIVLDNSVDNSGHSENISETEKKVCSAKAEIRCRQGFMPVDAFGLNKNHDL